LPADLPCPDFFSNEYITAIYGQNGSGKTALVDSFGLLRDAEKIIRKSIAN